MTRGAGFPQGCGQLALGIAPPPVAWQSGPLRAKTSAAQRQCVATAVNARYPSSHYLGPRVRGQQICAPTASQIAAMWDAVLAELVQQQRLTGYCLLTVTGCHVPRSCARATPGARRRRNAPSPAPFAPLPMTEPGRVRSSDGAVCGGRRRRKLRPVRRRQRAADGGRRRASAGGALLLARPPAACL